MIIVFIWRWHWGQCSFSLFYEEAGYSTGRVCSLPVDILERNTQPLLPHSWFMYVGLERGLDESVWLCVDTACVAPGCVWDDGTAEAPHADCSGRHTAQPPAPGGGHRPGSLQEGRGLREWQVQKGHSYTTWMMAVNTFQIQKVKTMLRSNWCS